MTVFLHDERRSRRSARTRAGAAGPLRRLTTAALALLTAAGGAIVLAPSASAAPAPAVQSATSGPKVAAVAAEADDPYKVLVFSKTGGFRHADGINAGKAAITALGVENNFTADISEDSASFTEANLAQYKSVIFLSTTGDNILTAPQKAAFEAYIKAGGGYFGVHSASDTEYQWPWYAGLVGAYFSGHPAGTPQGKIFVEDRVHPMTAGMGDEITINEEWYNFRLNPRSNVHVLASADVTSFAGSTMGRDHPLAWCQDTNDTTGLGRAAYTALGHDGTNWTTDWFKTMVLAGIETTAGVVDADCGATLAKNYDVISLDDNTIDPLALDIAADGRVFYIQQTGTLRVIDPVTHAVSTAATLPVITSNESGLLGIALDPNFAENKFVFLFHSPAGADVDRLSRFTYDDATKAFVPGSEKIVLDVPVQRAECCHHGGSMVFDADGNLYLATGDNTNPFASAGYSPIDFRAGRSAWDAARTSGNTNTLNGKVLKITPQADGTYTVPEGNLFAPGTAQTKAEIFAMGLRNPFRIGVDPATGHVMVADYGPDASGPLAGRGPGNTVEWNIIDEPGFYGWPFCTGANAAYNRWNFANETGGTAYECAAGVVNDSPNNTGLGTLPPAKAADVWYGYGGSSGNFPEVGGGGAPMAGPTYRYDEDVVGDGKWPAYWDGKPIWSEWNRSTTYASVLTDDGTTVQKVNQITNLFALPEGSQRTGNLRIMDSKFGPDGSLYAIDWGSGWSNNTNSGIYRIDYLAGDRAPIARATADKLDGGAPLVVQFSSAGSVDPEGTPLTYLWDFGDGTTSTDANPSHSFAAGAFRVQLTVSDEGGKSGVSFLDIVSGNNRPVVTIDAPLDGQFFDFGDQLEFKATVTDVEDGTTENGSISCDLVKIQNQLGHYSVGDSHAHPMGEQEGCTGTIQTLADGGHGGDVWLYWVIEVSYTDKGTDVLTEGLTGTATVILQTKRREAEFFNGTGRIAGSTSTGDAGVQLENASDPLGGTQQIAYVEPGDWVSYERVNLTGIDAVAARVAGSAGADLELRWNAPDGELLATIPAKPTTGWTDYQTSQVELGDVPAESGTLYVVAKNAATTGSVVNVNWFDFLGKGATSNERPTIDSASVTPLVGNAPLTVDVAATGSDPEGEAVSFGWDLGTAGGDTIEGATGSFTYTVPGTYFVKVRVSDEGGAFSEQTFQVKVNAPPPSCLGDKSDNFDGTALDTERWTVLRGNQDLQVAEGRLRIPTSATDIHQGTNNGANVVLQPMPDGAWEIVTKVTGTLNNQYQQAGLIVHGTDDNYIKLVLQGRSNPGDAATRVIQYLHESNATAQERNSANLGAAFPTTVWLKLAYNGTEVIGSYSADGQDWIETSTFANWNTAPKNLNGFGDDIKVGLLSVAGANNPVTNADFDFFQLSPDETATVAEPNDEFDGPSIVGCRWEIVRPEPSAVSFVDGQLTLVTASGEPGEAKNVLLQNQPVGDSPNNWVIETKVDGTGFSGGYQQTGLIAYVDAGNFVKFNFIRDNATTTRIELRSNVAGSFVNPQPQVTNPGAGSNVWHLRLERQDNNFIGSYSADGITWTPFAESVANVGVASDGKVGVFAAGVQQTTPGTAKIDYFRVIGDEPTPDTTAPVTTAAVSDADPAMVTLTATDEEGGSGVAITQYRINTQTWTTYTGPFSVVRTASAQSIEFRSIDEAGNEESVKSAEVPAAVPTEAPAEITTATACLAGKAVLTVRLRNTGTEAAKIVVTTPFGTKTFASVTPKGLAIHNFAAPAKTFPAGEITITATAVNGGQELGTSTVAFAARTCA